MLMRKYKRSGSILICAYIVLFILGFRVLFHGFPDTERFFAEWRDERITLSAIMKLGVSNFAPTIIIHPPLYHYLTFIPIGMFFIFGKLAGFFYDKVDFVRFYFNNTHYFFFIGRMMSYIFFWLSALMVFKVTRLFYNRAVSHITALSYLLIPRFIFDFSTTRPETILFLTTEIHFYFFLKYYLDNEKVKYLFLSGFFLGVSTAAKYNAVYLAAIFIVVFFDHLITAVRNRDYRDFLALWIKACLAVFIGFFICHPFFIIQIGKYFHNLRVFTMEQRFYWNSYANSSHLQELMSFIYINLFGLLVLFFGFWRLFKEHKKLFIPMFCAILFYEIYFELYLRGSAPLYFINPLIPIAALVFSAGVNFIIMQRRKLLPVLISFAVVVSYNYFDIWKGLSLGQTHIQKARAFIEKSVPEFSVICLASNNYIPQLNMTRKSYYHLISTGPVVENIAGHELTYKNIENEKSYDSASKELRIESLIKSPQYNLVRWDKNIKTENDAMDFFKENDIKYVIANCPLSIENKRLEDTKTVSLLKVFEPRNKRIYKLVYNDVSVFIYKLN